MLRQASFSDLEYANKKRRTRRELVLAEMEAGDSGRGVLGVGGAGGSVAEPLGGGRAALSADRRARPSTGRLGIDAADLLSSAMVRLVGPSDGGCALRHGEPASVRGFS